MTINRIIKSSGIAAIAAISFAGLASADDLSSANKINLIIQSINTIDNSSQRFFRQGQIQLEEEITDLQQGEHQLDDSILTIDSEVIDDPEEIQQLR
jgi:hypothetical protein